MDEFPTRASYALYYLHFKINFQDLWKNDYRKNLNAYYKPASVMILLVK